MISGAKYRATSKSEIEHGFTQIDRIHTDGKAAVSAGIMPSRTSRVRGGDIDVAREPNTTVFNNLQTFCKTVSCASSTALIMMRADLKFAIEIRHSIPKRYILAFNRVRI